MRIEEWKLERLKEYANNPRKNDHAVEAVAKAIKAYGFKVPILARSSGEIIDGHLRYKAAIYAGLDTVPVLVSDDLSDDEVRAFRISVNKVAELAKWDMSLLEQELLLLSSEDVDLSVIGFSEVELDQLFGLKKTTNKDPDSLPSKPPRVSMFGDMWHLGDHLLLVGDATSGENYNKMGGGGDMVWTDPPYNVDYSGKAGKIKNDKMSESEFDVFLSSFFKCIFSVLRPGAPIYVAHADGKPGISFRKSFNSAGFYFSGCLIWRKNQATLGRSDYQYQHEPILYGWKPGAPHSWYGGRKRRSIVDIEEMESLKRVDDKTIHVNIDNETFIVSGDNLSVSSFFPTIISINKPLKSESHPTMKPVSLVEHFLINSSTEGDVVWDPFGGSGTTLMACEIRNRKARIMELDPNFADVIIFRWQEYTGKEAVLSDGRLVAKVLKERGQRAEEN